MTNDLGRVPSEPGSQGFAPQPPSASSPAGADPSRLRAINWEHARRGMSEWAEMLQGQIVTYAQGIARDAANPLIAGYLAGRTAELHELASRLAAIRTVKDGWFRDSDESDEGMSR